MALIMLASVLAGFFAGAFFGWVDMRKQWKNDFLGSVEYMITRLFAGTFIGMVNGGLVCGITALVRYFV